MFGTTVPFANYCGITEIEGNAEKVRIGLTLGDDHCNHLGFAHGGVTLTLFDVALGSAARLASGQMVVTINMQTSFITPGRGRLICEARVLQRGRSICFCEGEVHDAAGALVAKASGVFKILREPSPKE